METKRIFGLDLVRVIAILLVVMVHVFLHNGFYIYDLHGLDSFILLVIRNICMACVPLFILLTGYLKYNKKLNKDHYKSLTKILIVYFIIAIITVLFDIFYNHNNFNVYRHIFGIFNFSINKYAWYIEMYIGLFLLIPFLNTIYHGLNTKKNKIILIGTLLFLTSIPYTLDNISLDILPMYWKEIYILAYYFIGMYIREYKPTIKKIINVLLILLMSLIQTISIFIFIYNKPIEGNLKLDYNSIFTVIISVLIFVLLYDIKTDKKVIKKPIEIISNTTLEIYLFSYIFDIVVYDYANRGIINIVENCYKSFITNVPAVFVLSLIAGIILRYILKFIKKIIEIIKNPN